MRKSKLSKRDRTHVRKLRKFIAYVTMNWRGKKRIIRSNDNNSYFVIWDIKENKNKEMDNTEKFNNMNVDDIYLLENNRYDSEEAYHTAVLQVVSKDKGTDGFERNFNGEVTFRVLMAPNTVKFKVGDLRVIAKYSHNFGKLKKLEDYKETDNK